jgi:UDPglucose--hexose-1-phosphate uridylyltransferase
MSEMRWNPLLQEWVVTATHRQDRTFLPPENFCPLCPTSDQTFPTEIPDSNFEFAVFENKFPSFQRQAPIPSLEATELLPVQKAQGVCEVVLYTPEHNSSLVELPLEKVRQLISVWRDRYEELGRREEIKYVFIFENKGESIGVTIPHPHGQIYAFTYLPPKIAKEVESAAAHFQKTNRCLHCDILAEELQAESNQTGSRIVAENDRFVAFVPFYARWPYEVHLYAKHHLPSLSEFDARDDQALAELLKTVVRKYDLLWGFSMPYMMVMHQKPTDGKEHHGSHFHIEFYPPHRTPAKMKFLAGCESGAGTFINDTLPEEKALELRVIEVAN